MKHQGKSLAYLVANQLLNRAKLLKYLALNASYIKKNFSLASIYPSRSAQKHSTVSPQKLALASGNVHCPGDCNPLPHTLALQDNN